jgi:uncharacterized membrane protein
LSIPLVPFFFSLLVSHWFIVGVSLVLSNQRKKQHNPNISTHQLFLSQLYRGLTIFTLGMVITVVTYFYPHEGYIRFGVLHCIGLSIILSFWFLRFRLLSAIVGVIIIIIGALVQQFTVTTSYLLWLGLKPSVFYTVDYFPLLPWFGVILLGISLGNTLFKKNSRLYSLRDLSHTGIIRSLSYLGRHSLLIYFFHQPVILLLLYPFMS